MKFAIIWSITTESHMFKHCITLTIYIQRKEQNKLLITYHSALIEDNLFALIIFAFDYTFPIMSLA